MSGFFARLEPTLGELESAYRQHFLKTDVQQLASVGWIYVAAMCLYVPIDFGLYGFTTPFWILTMARVLVIFGGLYLVKVLKQVTAIERFDRLLLLGCIATFSLSLLVHLLRGNTANYNLSVTVLLIVINYLLVPIPFVWRFLTSVIFALLESMVFLLLSNGDVAAEIRNNLVALVLANVLGVVVSARLYTFRRNQYKAQRDEHQARLEIERLATTDALTGVYNRRKWLEEANRILARFLRSGQRFSVLYLDIDHFKRLNDTHGHATGDVVLKHFAELVSKQVRELDVLGRFGGEEFVVLLPETTLENAKTIAQRIRATTEATAIRMPEATAIRMPEATSIGAANDTLLHITVSLGLAEVSLEDSKIEDVLQRADEALYQAKALGRNRVALESPRKA
jgi:diguanylate cyclase